MAKLDVGLVAVGLQLGETDGLEVVGATEGFVVEGALDGTVVVGAMDGYVVGDLEGMDGACVDVKVPKHAQ